MRVFIQSVFVCLIVISIAWSGDAAKVTAANKKISKKSTQASYSVQDEQQERPLNTTESSVIHQEALPDTPPVDEEEGADASPPTSDTEDSHPVFFKLLDEDERHNPSVKSEDAGRSKFPRVYYGEVEDEKRDTTKVIREDNPGVKGKRYEYTHTREPSSVDHTSPHERHEEESYGIGGQREDGGGFHGGRYGDDYSPYRHHGYQGHHYGPPAFGYHPAAEAIGKALKVLIPSALVLTGVSALFPNRIKVPTNDYVNINQHQRNKRSLDYERSLNTDDYLTPEHRAAIDSNEDQLGTYNYNIGRYGEYLPSENSNEFIASSPEFKSWGLKNTEGFPSMDDRKDDQLTRPFMSRPSTPQEYDNFNFSPQVYNFIVPESTYQPEGEIKAEPTEHVPTTAASITEEPTQKKSSTGEKMKRKRRPVNRPTSVSSTAASPAIIEEIEKIAPYKKMPTESTKVTSTTENNSFVNDLTTANEKLEQVLNNLQSLQAMGTEASLMFQKKPATADSPAGKKDESVDLSPDGPVMGLITSYAAHDKDSPTCQKRALCDLAMRGRNNGASRFESFLWNLATLVPEQFSKMYELEDIFKAIKEGDCKVFDCATPNLDIQL